MRPLIAITQRVCPLPDRNEVRDCLDVNWVRFLDRCGMDMIPLATRQPDCRDYLERLGVSGIILSGGNSVEGAGESDHFSERDRLEMELIAYALEKELPLVGVCRGMQMLCHYFGGNLTRVEGHVATRHMLHANSSDFAIPMDGYEVNSYHEYAIMRDAVPAGLEIMAESDGEIVEAVVSRIGKNVGIMWHPEREIRFRDADVQLMKAIFNS